ncbi:MAG: GNAT family N-acetyltransferase [Dehalococcoidales bacterium]|nr:GNAT family N-acetyltransferase [Dehalococcoidales bacterium]
MKDNLFDRTHMEGIPQFAVRVFTDLTGPPPLNALNAIAMIYMSGFNEPPWDIYDWNFTPERVVVEVAKLVSTVLSSGGALISLMHQEKPAGFSIVSSLDVFSRRPEKTAKPGELPVNYHDPGEYFRTLSHLLRIPPDKFNTIGYIADIVIDPVHRGQGLSKLLLSSSLKYLKDGVKTCALAWTVNPVMAGALSRTGFALVNGIGDKGEGIDFTLYKGTWHPVLVLPAEHKNNRTESVVARHFLMLF